MFQGSAKRDAYSYQQFERALNAFLPNEPGCVDQLDPWFQRPNWFVPRTGEIKEARGCVEKLFAAFPQELEVGSSTFSDACIVADIFPSVIPVLFGAEANYIMDTEYSEAALELIASHRDKYVGLQAFVKSIPQMDAIISADASEATADKLIARLDPSTPDGRFIRRIVESGFTHLQMIHFPAFADSVRDSDLWKICMDAKRMNFDAMDYLSAATRYVLLRDPLIEYHAQARSFPGWGARAPREGLGRSLAGIEQVDNEENFFKQCLPMSNSDFAASMNIDLVDLGETWETYNPHRSPRNYELSEAFFAAETKDPMIYSRFFSCMLDAVRTGELTATEANIGTLMWWARIVSAASSFFEYRALNTVV